MPNETWQSDFTHYPLTDTDTLPKGVEIISWLDDCTRYALHVCRHTGRSPRDRDRHLPRRLAPGLHASAWSICDNGDTFHKTQVGVPTYR